MVINQNGGKLIDSGTFGCINYPPLSCWSRNAQRSRNILDKNFVSKIMTNDEAEYEIENIKEIKKLDNLNVFTFENIKACSAKEFNEKNDNLSKCNIISQTDVSKNKCFKKNCLYTHNLKNNYSIILMPKLEYTLFDLMMEIIESDKTLKNVINDGLNLVLNLFYGLAFISQNKFLHFDVKENNFGFDGKKPIFFDFGLSSKFNIGKKLIYNPSKRISQSMDYYMYQLTSACLLDKIAVNVSKSTLYIDNTNSKKIMNDLIEWMKKYEDTNFYINLDLVADLYNMDKNEYLKKHAKTLVIIYGYSLPTFNSCEKKWLAQKVLETIDTYALGMSLLFYLNVIKDSISIELENDLKELIKDSTNFNIIERLWPVQLIKKADKLIRKHNLEKKFFKLRKYTLKKEPETPSRIKEISKLLE